MSTCAFRGILSRPHPQLYSGIFCRGHGVDGLSWAWSGLSVAADVPLHVAHSRPLLFEVAEAFFVSRLELSATRQAVLCLLQEELDEKWRSIHWISSELHASSDVFRISSFCSAYQSDSSRLVDWAKALLPVNSHREVLCQCIKAVTELKRIRLMSPSSS